VGDRRKIHKIRKALDKSRPAILHRVEGGTTRLHRIRARWGDWSQSARGGRPPRRTVNTHNLFDIWSIGSRGELRAGLKEGERLGGGGREKRPRGLEGMTWWTWEADQGEKKKILKEV